MTEQQVIHNLDGDKTGFPVSYFFVILVTAIILGLLTGFGLTKLKKSGTTASTSAINKGQEVKKTAGIVDKKTFKDQSDGVLREGGLEEEGSYHLERPGGISQNVYLTSTTVDLAQYVGKKVKVYGQTYTAQKAGWLMDVGLVEVL